MHVYVFAMIHIQHMQQCTQTLHSGHTALHYKRSKSHKSTICYLQLL